MPTSWLATWMHAAAVPAVAHRGGPPIQVDMAFMIDFHRCMSRRLRRAAASTEEWSIAVVTIRGADAAPAQCEAGDWQRGLSVRRTR